MRFQDLDERVRSTGVAADHANLIGSQGASSSRRVTKIEHLVQGSCRLHDEVSRLPGARETLHGFRDLKAEPIFDSQLRGRAGSTIFIKAKRPWSISELSRLIALQETADAEIHMSGMQDQRHDPMTLTAIVELAHHSLRLSWRFGRRLSFRAGSGRGRTAHEQDDHNGPQDSQQ